MKLIRFEFFFLTYIFCSTFNNFVAFNYIILDLYKFSFLNFGMK